MRYRFKTPYESGGILCRKDANLSRMSFVVGDPCSHGIHHCGGVRITEQQSDGPLRLAVWLAVRRR